MRLYPLFILILFINTSNGQSFSYPSIKVYGKRIVDFVPDGWTILDSTYGDLNKDRVNDAAIILQHQDSVTIVNKEEDTVWTQPRILLILFKNDAEKIFELKDQSNSFILPHENSFMDDPYQGIYIDKGILKLDFQLFYNSGSWYSTSSTYKFRYDGQAFSLIGADLSTIHRATLDYEDYSYNFLTKKRTYIKGNAQKGTKRTSLKTLGLSSPKTFKTFQSPYSWEVETDIYL